MEGGPFAWHFRAAVRSGIMIESGLCSVRNSDGLMAQAANVLVYAGVRVAVPDL
jgi:hypothetical protein